MTKKYRKLGAVIIGIVLVIMSIFVSTQIPSTNPKINDLPLVIVNQDKGEMSKQIVEKLKENSNPSDKLSISWTELDSKDEVLEKMNNEEYYGALVIPENFSQNIASMATPNPQVSEFDIIINQGKNAQVSTQVTQLLTGIVNNSGQAISNQVVARAEAANQTLPAKTVQTLMNPVKVNVENVQEVNNLANAGMILFQPTWLAGLITAVLLFSKTRKDVYKNKKEKLNSVLSQLAIITVASLVGGYSLPYLVEWILDVTIPNYNVVAPFLSLTIFTFITLILGFASWLGYAAFPIFGLLLFYGGPVLQLIPEMLGSFYTKWLMPILPMKPLFDGVRSILFYGAGFNNGAMSNLLIFLAIGVILLLTSIYKKDKVKK